MVHSLAFDPKIPITHLNVEVLSKQNLVNLMMQDALRKEAKKLRFFFFPQPSR